LQGTGVETDRGILVDAHLQTSIPGVYAIGDCAQLRTPTAGRRAIEAIWYTGRMMGQTVAHTICGQATAYQPRLWFNSAKFFDIEYQIYGDVPAQLPSDHDQIYWQHPKQNKAIRIRYHAATGAVLGFHLMGIRYRHEVCEKWILAGAHIETVLSELALANFDPEFFTEYEPQLRAVYTQKTGIQIKSTAPRHNLGAVLKFLKNKVL
jgi:NADPH-dependent 2,4-dienoyl-CoA reductase/sulfur reductase-like enzyme